MTDRDSTLHRFPKGLTIAAAVAAILLLAGSGLHPAEAQTGGPYEVFGVDGDNMLKMRAGPGTGYKIVLGLPNGTILRVHNCQQTGSTRWCKVSLKQSRAISGYVSWTYLREI